MTTTTEGVGPGAASGPLRGFDLDNIRKVFINQSGTLLPCIYIVGSGDTSKYVLRATGDGQVKIDSTDVPDYLGAKLVEGTNINFTVSVGPNKTLTIDATDQFVKVDAGDSTSGYLATKLIAGTNITLTPSVGPNKTLTIDATDQFVKVDAGDSTSGYLATKLIAGTNITLTPSVGPNKTLTIASTGSSSVTTITKTANYVIQTTDQIILVDTLSIGAFTLTLFAPTDGANFEIYDIAGNLSVANLTLQRFGAEKIAGVAADKIFQTDWGAWKIISNGTDWFIK